MNAYELAEKLENKDRLWSIEEKLMIGVCHMLKKQADRIAELEKQIQKQVGKPVETVTVYEITPEMIGAKLGLKPRRKK